ncbi:hypothetical protein AGABI1DRAFT_126823 [Agaricus bisporus var. burnettii JB137-S8]|uniref:DUF218 domain-containing protein n=1 Tax=Agaricus bisporus var. burnettii (strain JB137-S8 / ATCC MYA-4627 / FGSC 10392) TaxID=597362 RepID=K5XCF1_AGABU|nr:uncharacterized protein AGABI1DRAFT_126823 [Agaricus bisporus var. burnettii JB137-S8]EKM80782.1 hypothetical protein AGABI1DRAFT_126823 [Agaricus bisporus var. burnettii JB137-S8]
MLPSPATSAKRSGFRRIDVGPPRNITKRLLSRSRFTNLGIIILLLITLFSLYHNLRFWLASFATYPDTCLAPPTIRNSNQSAKFGSVLWATVTRPRSLKDLNHLVVIPGHAIWIGNDTGKRLDDSEWILEPYQKGKARLEALYQHIQRGKRGSSFIGGIHGQTRSNSIMTEAQSYLRLASSIDRSALPPDNFDRLTTEDHALDSFQNLLFSIARFKEYTGRYPEQITVVGYEFKRRRFEDLHRAAIHWPENKFNYHGIDPNDDEHVRIATEGERANGFIPYSKDTYGCHPPLLDKRQNRNPFQRFHSYYFSAPELDQLLDWCPETQTEGWTALFPQQLPWYNPG